MQKDVVLELIRIVPAFLWVGLIFTLMFMLREPTSHVLIPRMTGVKVFGVEASFVKEELDRVADRSQVGSEHSRSQTARRAARLAPTLNDARLLLVNDKPQESHNVVRILESLKLRVSVAVTAQQVFRV